MTLNWIVIILLLQISSASIFSISKPQHQKFLSKNCLELLYYRYKGLPVPKWLHLNCKRYSALNFMNVNALAMISRSIDGKGNNIDHL